MVLRCLIFAASLLIAVSAAQSQTLNPTGRTLDLIMPVVQDGRLIGDATLRIGADDTLTVNAAGVLGLLVDRINAETAETVTATADVDGRVPLSAFDDAGAELRYDPASLVLDFTPSRAALGKRSLSLDGQRIRSKNVSAPASFSGFANFTGGVRYEENDGFGLDDVDIEGGIRARDIVLEGAVRYDENDEDIRRRFTRAVYDHPSSGRRFVAGDYRSPFSGLAGSVELLGVAVENTGALRPFDNLRPRGRSSFELERTSTVEIYSNGTLERRLRLDPGIYDLTDIPLVRGANEITITVEDDLGRREIARFDRFFGDELLAKGKLLYSAATGIVADTVSDRPDYDEGRPALSAGIDYGLTDEITVGADARLTLEQGLVGLSAATVTRLGTFGIDLAGSYNEDRGEGGSAELRWQYFVKRQTPLTGFRDEVITAAFGFRSDGFVSRDPFDLDEVEETYVFDFSLGYIRPLSENLTLNIGAFYGLAQRSDNADRLQLFTALGGRINDRYTWSLRAEYVADEDDRNEGFGIGLQVGMRLGEDTQASARYNSRDNRAGAFLRHAKGQGVGAYSVALLADRADDDVPDITATAAYTGNRFIANAFHREEIGGDSPNGRTTGLRFGSAIAFADGHVAIGRPVNGAFVIATAHPSLEDKRVILGREGAFHEAQSDVLGPALASGYTAYRPARMATDIENLPIGYDLGAGLVEMEPPYRAGYHVEIGSDAQITVTGTLLDTFGNPLGLVTGIARHADDPDFPPLQIFTNRSGRFALLGAKPGRYRLEMSDGARADVTAPADALGLVRVGKVTAE